MTTQYRNRLPFAFAAVLLATGLPSPAPASPGVSETAPEVAGVDSARLAGVFFDTAEAEVVRLSAREMAEVKGRYLGASHGLERSHFANPRSVFLPSEIEPINPSIHPPSGPVSYRVVSFGAGDHSGEF
ncbi:MAG: hypothetical protein J4G09_08065 [Proteobacteria bacterium]|nr:hypothetical protein [Pseudomonadota bacterium]